ncbi:MAG: amidohydrolase family protein [Chloroflexi bacterium]|nr:amidohydrolase family protein [Chloroflexota bacterium]
MPTTLIRNGRLITASEDFVADILIEGETIKLIGTDLPLQAERVINATGLLVFPGGIDPHVHLHYPQGPNRIVSSDDWLTGTIAAAFGGTTTVLDFVEAKPGESFLRAFDARLAEASDAVIDFGFHMTFNRADDAARAQVPAVIAAGMSSFKIYMAYDNIRLTDREMLVALETLKAHNGLPIIHAEDHDVIVNLGAQQIAQGHTEPRWHPFTRPIAGEADATARALAFAEIVGVPMHIVHVSTARGLRAIADQRARGFPSTPQRSTQGVTGEVCAQHLLLTDALYDQPSVEPAKYVMAPPLRPESDTRALWEGLRDGALEFVITDHCPFTMAQRLGQRRTPEFRKLPTGVVNNPTEPAWSNELPAFNRMPGGAPGIETRVPLLFHYGVNEGRLSLNQFVNVTSTAAAKLFGLYPRKGTLAPGADADIVLFDPARQVTISAQTLHQNCDYTPYEGMRVKGWARTVLCRGEVIVENGAFKGTAGGGKYLKRSNYAASPGIIHVCRPVR